MTMGTQSLQPVVWQYRHYDSSSRFGDPDHAWSDWKPVSEAKYREINGYIAQGHQYQTRALAAVVTTVTPTPDPHEARAADLAIYQSIADGYWAGVVKRAG